MGFYGSFKDWQEWFYCSFYFCLVGREKGYECVLFVWRYWYFGNYSNNFFVYIVKKVQFRVFGK